MRHPVAARRKVHQIWRDIGRPEPMTVCSDAALRVFELPELLKGDLIRNIRPGTYGEITVAHVDAALVRIIGNLKSQP